MNYLSLRNGVLYVISNDSNKYTNTCSECIINNECQDLLPFKRTSCIDALRTITGFRSSNGIYSINLHVIKKINDSEDVHSLFLCSLIKFKLNN
jgi:hypothetical protein